MRSVWPGRYMGTPIYRIIFAPVFRDIGGIGIPRRDRGAYGKAYRRGAPGQRPRAPRLPLPHSRSGAAVPTLRERRFVPDSGGALCCHPPSPPPSSQLPSATPPPLPGGVRILHDPPAPREYEDRARSAFVPFRYFPDGPHRTQLFRDWPVKSEYGAASAR